LQKTYKLTLSVIGVEKEGFNENPKNLGYWYLNKIGSKNGDRDGALSGPNEAYRVVKKRASLSTLERGLSWKGFGKY